MVFIRLLAACSLAALTGAVVLPEAINLERRLANPFPTSKFPHPSLDPFYSIPKAAVLATYAPGDILRQRDITADIVPGLDSSVIDTVYQLAYKTRTAMGAGDVTVTTVFKPKNPQSPPKVLGIAMFEDAAALDCSNSYGLLKDTDSNHTLVALSQVALFNAALHKGYYVSAPDFEGSQAAFTSGYAEGSAMLDGIRAFLRHKQTIADTKGNEIVITGYSGGGHGAGWAAQLAKEYAPELNIIGVAHGGTPVDLEATFVNLNKNLFSGFGLSGLAGLANAYPDLNEFVDQNIDAEVRQIIANLRTGAFCIPSLLGKYAYYDFFSHFVGGASALKKPIPAKYFELNRMGARGAKDVVKGFPRLVFHAELDQVIPLEPVRKYVEEQCAAGSQIEFSLSISEHATETLIGLPKSFNWVVSAFEHKLNQTGCTRTAHSLLDLFDPLFELNAGPVAAKQAQSKSNLDFFKL